MSGVGRIFKPTQSYSEIGKINDKTHVVNLQQTSVKTSFTRLKLKVFNLEILYTLNKFFWFLPPPSERDRDTWNTYTYMPTAILLEI